MRNQAIARIIFVISIIVSGWWSAAAVAQDAAPAPTFKTEELDQMLAPIALYPDDVLANVLMASTYPLEVAQAARWREDSSNAKLKGDALTKALEAKTWDPSVKSLTQFPDILKLMSNELEWTQKLGDAFLAQEDDVFGRIQYLRQKADESGNLKSTKKQKVTKKERPSGSSGEGSGSLQSSYYYTIEPVDPEYIYVPVYEPSVVYGSWWYPSYPPYYWDWYPGSTLVSGIFWGAGFAIATNLWNWGSVDWGRGDINIDVDRFNNINIKGDRLTDGRWQHNPKHRGPVPYKDKVSRDKFGKGNKFKDTAKDFRGFDKDKLGQANVDRVKDKLGSDRTSNIKDRVGEGGASKIKDKMGDGGADRIKNKLGEGGGSKLKDKAGDRGGSKIKDKAGSRDRPATRDAKKSSRRPSSKGASKSFDVKPKAEVRKNVNRGSASRKSAASHRGGGPRMSRGGGGRSFGGGGGRRGGGGGRGGRRSDIRLKTDIVPLARLDSGYQLYRFRYKGNDHTAYVGVMAQEVQEVEPSAVISDRKGFLSVDYERIGVKFMTWKEWLTNDKSSLSSSGQPNPVSAGR